MKKAFTLIEILATITILGIVSLITIPIVSGMINKNKEKLYNVQVESIKDGAEKWAYKNLDLLPSGEGESITITLLELKKSGNISLDIRDPRNNNLLPNDMQIKITFESNNYVYEVLGETGTEITSEVNENSPILILLGNPIEYVEIGSEYNELGAIAKDINGNNLDVTVIYRDNNVEIGSIPTNDYKTYMAIYNAESIIDGNLYTSRVTRTVIVRDTTAPNLTVPSNITINLSEVDSFDVLEGVVATDNSGEELQIEVLNYDKTVGEKVVSYKVCDSHNNCATKKRIIRIN